MPTVARDSFSDILDRPTPRAEALREGKLRRARFLKRDRRKKKRKKKLKKRRGGGGGLENEDSQTRNQTCVIITVNNNLQ